MSKLPVADALASVSSSVCVPALDAIWLPFQTRLQETGWRWETWKPLPGDAGYRRYARFSDTENAWIACYAPVATEGRASRRFVDLARLFAEFGFSVPDCLFADWSHGWFVFRDLGERRFDTVLATGGVGHAHALYRDALEVLSSLQTLPERCTYKWGLYTPLRMQQELQLFVDWYLVHYWSVQSGKGIPVDALSPWPTWTNSWITAIFRQPRALVHRDFQSRNLVYCPVGDSAVQRVGLLDFQDACWGPFTYDCVSLLWDCYLDSPLEARLERLLEAYRILGISAHGLSFPEWRVQVCTMGLQRHLKNLGIFVRLAVRDQKVHYLAHIPRTWEYVCYFATQVPEADRFCKLLERLQ